MARLPPPIFRQFGRNLSSNLFTKRSTASTSSRSASVATAVGNRPSVAELQTQARGFQTTVIQQPRSPQVQRVAPRVLEPFSVRLARAVQTRADALARPAPSNPEQARLQELQAARVAQNLPIASRNTINRANQIVQNNLQRILSFKNFSDADKASVALNQARSIIETREATGQLTQGEVDMFNSKVSAFNSKFVTPDSITRSAQRQFAIQQLREARLAELAEGRRTTYERLAAAQARYPATNLAAIRAKGIGTSQVPSRFARGAKKGLEFLFQPQKPLFKEGGLQKASDKVNDILFDVGAKPSGKLVDLYYSSSPEIKRQIELQVKDVARNNPTNLPYQAANFVLRYVRANNVPPAKVREVAREIGGSIAQLTPYLSDAPIALVLRGSALISSRSPEEFAVNLASGFGLGFLSKASTKTATRVSKGLAALEEGKAGGQFVSKTAKSLALANKFKVLRRIGEKTVPVGLAAGGVGTSVLQIAPFIGTDEKLVRQEALRVSRQFAAFGLGFGAGERSVEVLSNLKSLVGVRSAIRSVSNAARNNLVELSRDQRGELRFNKRKPVPEKVKRDIKKVENAIKLANKKEQDAFFKAIKDLEKAEKPRPMKNFKKPEVLKDKTVPRVFKEPTPGRGEKVVRTPSGQLQIVKTKTELLPKQNVRTKSLLKEEPVFRQKTRKIFLTKAEAQRLIDQRLLTHADLGFKEAKVKPLVKFKQKSVQLQSRVRPSIALQRSVLQERSLVSTRPLSILGVSTLQKVRLQERTLQRVAQRTLQRVRQRQRVGFAVSQAVSRAQTQSRTLQRTLTRTLTKQVTEQAVTQNASRLAIGLVAPPQIAERSVSEPFPGEETGRRRGRFGFPIRRTGIEIPPSKSFKSKLFERKVSREVGGGFDTFVKVKKRFVKVSPYALSRKSALDLGATVVGNKALRTFRIFPSKGRPKKLGGLQGFFGNEYRVPKGKSKLPRGSFVEKSKYAINTLGEIAEISLKGAQARKTKAYLNRGLGSRNIKGYLKKLKRFSVPIGDKKGFLKRLKEKKI